MSTETQKTSAVSAQPITAISLVAAGLTLRGMTVSKQTVQKTWEGKTRTETEVGVSDGSTIYLWKIRHEDGKEPVLPALLVQVSVRVTYCTTDKGKVTVQGVMV